MKLFDIFKKKKTEEKEETGFLPMTIDQYFEFSGNTSKHLVIPKEILNRMSIAFQADLTDMLTEIDFVTNWRENMGPNFSCYMVKAKDNHGKLMSDPWAKKE